MNSSILMSIYAFVHYTFPLNDGSPWKELGKLCLLCIEVSYLYYIAEKEVYLSSISCNIYGPPGYRRFSTHEDTLVVISVKYITMTLTTISQAITLSGMSKWVQCYSIVISQLLLPKFVEVAKHIFSVTQVLLKD